jgi:hypothetical protein
MVRVSKRFLDRAKSNLRRYQKVLASAKARDVDRYSHSSHNPGGSHDHHRNP